MPHVPIHSHLRSWLLLVLAAAGPILGSLSATAAEAKKEEAKPADSTPWWNKEWTVRKKVVVRPDVPAAPLKEATGPLLVLLRLHEGNFQFGAAQSDGRDLRFVAADGQTLLPYRVEKFDTLMNEGIVWVRFPDIPAASESTVWMYYGNQKAPPPEGGNKAVYPENASLVYHFTENGAPPADATPNGNNANSAGMISEGALAGPGLRLFGTQSVEIPSTDSLAWKAGQEATLSVWMKPAGKAKNITLLGREEGAASFRLGLDDGVPFVEVKEASGTTRTTPGEALPDGAWKNLTVTATAAKIDLWVDGQAYGSIPRGLPALAAPMFLGGDPKKGPAFAGELDEFRIFKSVLGPTALRFSAVNQSGSEDSRKLVVVGDDEGSEQVHHSKAYEHIMLFGDIANNMMFDGWVVIFVCCIMAIVGWSVAIQKFNYLNRIKKGNDEFIRQWKKMAADLTALDQEDSEGMGELGAESSKKKQKLMRQSPLYHIYHIGSEEIQHRLQSSKGRFKGLSGRSIQAIKASLDSGVVHETHRLHSGLVFLTISIAGGPYVGLLGTVVGVMVTFAVIARSGEVEVNSIAPGIASALLATVAGLVVAIPALFIYSYLNSRIKDTVSNMHIFIDEFITKMAEFYKDEPEEKKERKAS